MLYQISILGNLSHVRLPRNKTKLKTKGISHGCSCGLFSTVLIIAFELLWKPKYLSHFFRPFLYDIVKFALPDEHLGSPQLCLVMEKNDVAVCLERNLVIPNLAKKSAHVPFFSPVVGANERSWSWSMIQCKNENFYQVRQFFLHLLPTVV